MRNILFRNTDNQPETQPTAERGSVAVHTEKALAGLPPRASAYDKAAAINAYVHLFLKRVSGSTAQTADEVLDSGEAVCGGMSLVMIKMLAHVGLRGEYAFTHGGLAAHSMVEVIFTDTVQGLFDPYHGLAFYSVAEGRPLSIQEIADYADADPAPVFYVQRSTDRNLPLIRENVYSETDEDGRGDFAFPGLFTEADGVGLANSGFVSFIHVELSPWDVLGDEVWTGAPDETPRPWTTLAKLQRASGAYVSWAYLLGQTSLGYRIAHVYALENLEPGRKYVLRLKIANAYVNKELGGLKPSVTLHPAIPTGRSQFVLLNARGYRADESYVPQYAELAFTAERPQMTFLGAATGDIVLQCISLVEADL
tara:strand:- start:349 stop:1449 length:1101 start_codon:yes stop_codon:yes gene_type:complete